MLTALLAPLLPFPISLHSNPSTFPQISAPITFRYSLTLHSLYSTIHFPILFISFHLPSFDTLTPYTPLFTSLSSSHPSPFLSPTSLNLILLVTSALYVDLPFLPIALLPHSNATHFHFTLLSPPLASLLSSLLVFPFHASLLSPTSHLYPNALFYQLCSRSPTPSLPFPFPFP